MHNNCFCLNQVSFFKAPGGTELISCPYFLPILQPILNISKCRIMSSGKINPCYTKAHTFIHSFTRPSFADCLPYARHCAKFWGYQGEKKKDFTVSWDLGWHVSIQNWSGQCFSKSKLFF